MNVEVVALSVLNRDQVFLPLAVVSAKAEQLIRILGQDDGEIERDWAAAAQVHLTRQVQRIAETDLDGSIREYNTSRASDL